MDSSIFETLHQQGFVSSEHLVKIRDAEKNKLISVHWEIKTLLYLGVLFFSGGLGLLVYKNIDSIGHAVVLTFIALLSTFGFFYCTRKKQPFTFLKAESPHILYDYLLLLSCLLMVTFIGYFQYQYQFFGNRYGLASFIPMLLLFVSAYFYDHLGVLSMAITNLGAWLGMSITPLTLARNFDWNTEHIVYTGVALGTFLIVISLWSEWKNIKAHFAFTYFNFGMHLLLVSLLAGMFDMSNYYLLWFIGFVPACYFVYHRAVVEKSFYKLLFAILYGYVALSYVLVRWMSWLESKINDADVALIYLGFFYFILSAAGMVMLLHRMNKKFGADDRI